MDSLGWIDEEIEELKAASLFRDPAVIATASGPEVEIAGSSCVLACSNNYLGLAGDARLAKAAADAAADWGAGSGASPLVAGLTSLHRELEGELAKLKSAEDAVLFSSGYLANIGAIQSLAGPGDAVFSDELNHASIIDGCRLSRAEVRIWRHCDPGHLAELLAAGGFRRALVVTDAVFSMDGDVAPLGEICEVAGEHEAMVMVDEAHATGVLGPAGAGAVEHLGLVGQVPVVMGTLSKALGSAGGFIAGPRVLCAWLRNRARGLIYETAPVPAAVGAALEALRVVAEEPWRRERLTELRERVVAGIREAGFEVADGPAPIIPVIVGGSQDAMDLAAALRRQGVFAPAIRPPTVPEGTARIRLTLMATHTDHHAGMIVAAFGAAAAR